MDGVGKFLCLNSFLENTVIIKLMPEGVGPHGSKMCEEIVGEFFECRRDKGLSGMLAGHCALLLREMNECLDQESRIRREENAITAKERREKYRAVRDKLSQSQPD